MNALNVAVLAMVPEWAKSEVQSRLEAGKTLPKGLLTAIAVMTAPKEVVRDLKATPAERGRLMAALRRYGYFDWKERQKAAAAVPAAPVVVAEPAPVVPAVPVAAPASTGGKLLCHAVAKQEYCVAFAQRKTANHRKTAVSLKALNVQGNEGDFVEVVGIKNAVEIDGVTFKPAVTLFPMGMVAQDGASTPYPIAADGEISIVQSPDHGGWEARLADGEGKEWSRSFPPVGNSAGTFGSFLYVLRNVLGVRRGGGNVRLYTTAQGFLDRIVGLRLTADSQVGHGPVAAKICNEVDRKGIVLIPCKGEVPVRRVQAMADAKAERVAEEKAKAEAIANMARPDMPRKGRPVAAAAKKAVAVVDVPAVADVPAPVAVAEIVAPVVAPAAEVAPVTTRSGVVLEDYEDY